MTAGLAGGLPTGELPLVAGDLEPPTGTAPGAWTVWSAAVLAYLVAVFERSSLSVAGVAAVHRFGVGPSTLAAFAVVQLLVYAAMQVPVGLLLDRFGSRRMIVTGLLCMSAGQLTFAAASRVGPALGGRILLGCGDAMIFVSLLRLVALWFAPARNPVLAQVTALVGQAGAIVAAVPLVHLLREAGWGRTYLVAGLLPLAAAGLVLATVRDAPAARARAVARRPPAGGWRQACADVRAVWHEPGTRLGLWTHATTPFAGTVFALLWGFPFLTVAEGRPAGTAAALLTLFTVTGMVAGPAVGALTARWPGRRSWVVLSVVGVNAATWSLVLAWPGRAPLALLAALVVAIGLGAPASVVAFDYARTFNPPSRIGTATGLVNVGGFVTAVVALLGVGLVLSALSGGSGADGYGLAAFRWAFAAPYAIWALGTVMILRERAATRARHATARARARSGAVLATGGCTAA